MERSVSPRILIVEAYTDANVGSGALVENSVKLLRSRYPDARLRVMAHYPKAFADWLGVDTVPDIFGYPYGQTRIRQVSWLCRTFVWMIIVAVQALLMSRRATLLYRSKVEQFLWADLVVSVGAERLNEKYVKNVVFSLFTYWLAGMLGCKVVLFPCTVGPLFRRTTRLLTRLVLRRLDLIFLRDEESARVVAAFHLPLGRVVTTADVAVLQDTAPISRAKGLVPSWPPGPWVGLSVMRWTYVHNDIETPYSNYGAYVSGMATLADEIVERYRVSVILFPTNYPQHGCREDDIAPSRQVLGRMHRGDRAAILERLPTPAELKALLGLCEVNVVTRMHACILSTGAGVPTISINYLFKLRSYMASLGMEEFSIDIEQFNSEAALKLFERIWAGRERWRGVLRERIAERRAHLSRSMEMLDALL